jgi:hypothetical protein
MKETQSFADGLVQMAIRTGWIPSTGRPRGVGDVFGEPVTLVTLSENKRHPRKPHGIRICDVSDVSDVFFSP